MTPETLADTAIKAVVEQCRARGALYSALEVESADGWATGLRDRLIAAFADVCKSLDVSEAAKRIVATSNHWAKCSCEECLPAKERIVVRILEQLVESAVAAKDEEIARFKAATFARAVDFERRILEALGEDYKTSAPDDGCGIEKSIMRIRAERDALNIIIRDHRTEVKKLWGEIDRLRDVADAATDKGVTTAQLRAERDAAVAAARDYTPRFKVLQAEAMFLGQWGRYDLWYRIVAGEPQTDWYDSCQNISAWRQACDTDGHEARIEALRIVTSWGLPVERIAAAQFTALSHDLDAANFKIGKLQAKLNTAHIEGYSEQLIAIHALCDSAGVDSGTAGNRLAAQKRVALLADENANLKADATEQKQRATKAEAWDALEANGWKFHYYVDGVFTRIALIEPDNVYITGRWYDTHFEAVQKTIAEEAAIQSAVAAVKPKPEPVSEEEAKMAWLEYVATGNALNGELGRTPNIVLDQWAKQKGSEHETMAETIARSTVVPTCSQGR